MIYDQWASILNLLAVAILAFLVTNLFASILFSRIKNSIVNYSIISRKILLWLIVLSPWFTSLFTILFFNFIFQSEFAFAWLTQFVHWHHSNVFYVFSWHSISLIVFTLFSLVTVINKMVVAYKNHHQINFLRTLSTKKSEKVFIIDSPIPSAFTGGLIKPYCFISTGLMEKLDSEDIEIIIQHELAHVHYFDPLKKLIFSFFSAYFIPNVKQVLVSMMTITIEQAADSFLIKNQQQAHNVASTLLKFTKLAANYEIHPLDKNGLNKNELFVHFCQQSLEQRVINLLSNKPLKSFPQKIILITILLLAFVSITLVDSLHHVIEILLVH